jgi:hypothetical protein
MADPYCCSTAWDGRCVAEANSICGKTCPVPATMPDRPSGAGRR